MSKQRLDDAIGQLTRYGSALEHDTLMDVLEAITDINDDLAHGRHIGANIAETKALLDRLEQEVHGIPANQPTG